MTSDEWQVMILNNTKKSSCFWAIFDPSDPYEKYLDKKTYIKKAFWLQPQAWSQCMNCKNGNRTCNYFLNDKWHSVKAGLARLLV